VKRSHLSRAKLCFELTLNLSQGVETLHQHEPPAATPKTDQLCTPIVGIRHPLETTELDQLVDQLTHRLFGDADASGELGQAGALEVDVGKQVCVHPAKTLETRRLAQASDRQLVDLARALEEQLPHRSPLRLFETYPLVGGHDLFGAISFALLSALHYFVNST